jgi:hypothetical protein
LATNFSVGAAVFSHPKKIVFRRGFPPTPLTWTSTDVLSHRT